MKAIRFLALAAAFTLLVPHVALAFCGFYVAGADGKLFNNATEVVLMREGTRTVLSMQNNYEGPPENFALVIPVPVVLQKENVKTLPREIFDHVDELTAPRLVEYWEEDPCAQPEKGKGIGFASRMAPAAAPMHRAAGEYGVTVEAEFTVGEYDIVILSANDSSGLEAWLRDNKYKIPDGAEPYLRPYVQGGSKFFVAKVDASKVTMQGDRTLLSPLRFHYDSETFNLPIRLGLINANGSQDLIVTILARGQRYEAANYKNVTIPTNLDVAEGARDQFGAMYAALFDKTLAANPHAVVTEYAWDASTCDPCPTPPLSMKELATLGADALPSAQPPPPSPPPPAPSATTSPGPLAPGMMPRRPRPPWPIGFGGGFVVSRLHTRYTRDSLGEDLVFVAAPPIQGGREWRGTDGQLEKQAQPGAVNNFQARYAIRHPWTGPIACNNPVRGRWGGPPGGAPAPSSPKAASRIAFAPRGGVELASLVREDVPEIGLATASRSGSLGEGPGPAPSPPAPPAGATEKRGCAGCAAAGGSSTGGAALAALTLLAWRGRRRRGSR